MSNTEPIVLRLLAEDETGPAFDSAERQIRKNKKAVDDLIKRLQFHADTVRMNADEIEIYKLQQKGASAATIQQAKNLQNLIRVERQKIATTKNMNGSLRMVRGGFGQLGHQVQDIAVQLQTGTNAMIVFGQQGSQIASLMGPGGAMIGAILAVGAALITSFTAGTRDAKNELEEFRKKITETRTELGLLTQAEIALNAQRKQEKIDAQRDAVAKLTAEREHLRKQTLSVLAAEIAYNKAVEDGDRATASKILETLAYRDSVEELRKEESELAAKEQEAKKVLEELTSGTVTAAEKEAERAKTVKQLVQQNEQLAATYGKTEKEVALYRAELAGANEEELLAIGIAQDTLARLKAEEEARKKTKEALKAEQQEAAKLARAKEQLTRISAVGLEGVDRINAQFDQQLRAAEKYYDNKKELHAEYVAAVNAIDAARGAAIEQFNADQLAKDAKKQEKLKENALGSLRTETEAFMHHIQMRYDALVLALEQEAITKEQFRENEKRLKEEMAEHDLEQQFKIIGGYAQLEKAASDALFSVFTHSQSASDALRQLGKTIIDSAIRGMIEMGMENIKQAMLRDKIQAASLAKSTAATGIAMSTVAASAAPAATLVSLATSGANSAGAIAGMTAAASTASGIAAMSFEGGGFTGYGARSGGIDGKGGFAAILHPNETVIDHSQGQGGVTIVQNINVTTGVQQTVRAEIVNLMPEISNAAKAAVAETRLRGGAYSKMMVGQ